MLDDPNNRRVLEKFSVLNTVHDFLNGLETLPE